MHNLEHLMLQYVYPWVFIKIIKNNLYCLMKIIILSCIVVSVLVIVDGFRGWIVCVGLGICLGLNRFVIV